MRRWAAGVALVLATTVTTACPLCMGGGARSPAQDIEELSRVVLATPAADGQSYRVIDVIKGARPEGNRVTDVVVREPAALQRKPLLLVRDDAWPMWASLGPIGNDHAAILRAVGGGHPADGDVDGWHARVDALVPHLESAEPLLAEIAFAEGAHAPYAALRSVKPRLNVSAIRRWLADPRLAQRQPLYLLLLGIAGDHTDAARVGQRLTDASSRHDTTSLASLLAADLELRGPSRMAWVEATYLKDRTRSRAEIDAALLALSVHGNSGGPIARERVIEAYRVFMREHRDLAGLVARDLASWAYWDAVPDYVALMKSGLRQQYASRASIVAYLRQSPDGVVGVEDK